jgi:hypothetical protein
MKRLSALIAVCLVMFGCSPDERKPDVVVETKETEVAPIEPAVVLPIDYGVVTENRVRVRTGPGTDTDTMGHLYVGDLIEIFERSVLAETIGEVSAPWIRIRTSFELEGWAFGAFIDETDQESYRDSFRRLSIATINIPWEPGVVTEAVITEGEWGPEWGVAGVAIDFTPDNVDALVGNPFRLQYIGNEEYSLSGSWRVRNGYLVTEIYAGESLHSSATTFLGFALWNLEETDASLFVTRELTTLFKKTAVRLYDASARVLEGEDRRIDNRIVQSAGLRPFVLAEDTLVREVPDSAMPTLEFQMMETNGKLKSRKTLPSDHTVILVARYDDWYYVDTQMGADDEGIGFGWIETNIVD